MIFYRLFDTLTALGLFALGIWLFPQSALLGFFTMGMALDKYVTEGFLYRILDKVGWNGVKRILDGENILDNE